MRKSGTGSDGVGLEYLDRLTLFDERFEYDGRSHDYKSIEHIEFTASVTKHSVNGIPTGTTYAANLVLHLEGRVRLHIQQESAFFGAKKKLRYEAVMRAASMLMGVSFNQRIESYENQLKQKKFIEWGQYQIHKDGDIFYRNQHCLNLRDPSVTLLLQPFEITFKKKPSGFGDRIKKLISNRDVVLNLSLDKDCFLYIMKNQFGFSWSNQPAPEKRKTSKRLLNEALLVLGAKLCRVDGHVSPQEVVLFKKYFGIDESTFPGAQRIFTDSLAGAATEADAAKRIYELFTGQAEPLEHILIGLMQVAASDGVIHHAELDFISRVAQTFGFSVSEIDRLFLIFDEFNGKGSKRADEAANAPTDTDVSRNLRILGLEAGVGFSEIKAAYRVLVKKHHPDLLRAQGLPLDDIEDAEQVLRVINEAYEWLESYYHERKHQSAN